MTWDATTIGALAVIVSGQIILIIGAFFTGLKMLRQSDAALALANRAATTADDASKKADVLVTTTAEIKELTNSTNSNLQKSLELKIEELAGSRAINQSLNEVVRDLKGEREKFAIAVAMATPVAVMTPVPTVPRTQNTRSGDSETVAKLTQIEAHTAATAENTAPE